MQAAPTRQTLAETLRRDGAFPAAKAVALISQVVAVVGSVHDRGIAHGDLSTTTLVFDGQGWLTVVPGRTAHGTQPDDVYAIGSILFEMIAGRPAPAGPARSAYQQRRPAAPRLRAMADVPALLDSTVSAMLAPDPAQRPTLRSVAEQLNAVRRLLEAQRPAVAAPARTRSSRVRIALPVAIAAAVVAAATAAAVPLYDAQTSSWGWTYDTSMKAPKVETSYAGGLAFDCGSVYDWLAKNHPDDLGKYGTNKVSRQAHAGDSRVCFPILATVLASF